MEMNSFKRTLKMGILSGACSYLLYAAFVLCIGYITKWQSFWVIDEVSQTVTLQPNGIISWEITIMIGLILASLVPVFLMRYEKVKCAVSYVVISLVAFVWLFGATLSGYYMIGDMKNTVLFCPFTTIDAFYYLIFVFLLGSAIGTLASFVINFIRNKD